MKADYDKPWDSISGAFNSAISPSKRGRGAQKRSLK
jgi:hypothetical protein